MSAARGRRDRLFLTCEHGGNRIPSEHRYLFRGAAEVLASHRGWDPGALTLAQRCARKLGAPLHAVTWSRLLVEANRAPANRRIWSTFTKALPRDERLRILAKWWQPHRDTVEQAVGADVARGRRLVHVAVHSFTPKLDGVVRNADVGFLYDSRRKDEARLCRLWGAILHDLDPKLRVRYNYPYSGAADGLTTWLRLRHPQTSYLGIELEVNQSLVGGKDWRRFQDNVAASLRELVPGR